MFENWYTLTEVFEALDGNTSNGLYAVKLKNKNAFSSYNPELHNEYVLRGQPDIIYVGKACRRGGIRARLRNELLQMGKGTFFRSVGAVLNFNPEPVAANPVNYTFAEQKKGAIIAFMEENFLVSYEIIESQDEIIAKEKRLIHIELRPIFNLQNNPELSPAVKIERARCIRFARGQEQVNGFQNHADDFICPQPMRWNDIYHDLCAAYENKTGENLPSNVVDIREAGGPPTPLILNGWVFTGDSEKRQRWLETVDWAKKYDLLQLLTVEEKDKYLGS